MAALDKLISLTFATLLSKKFIDWDAYKLGIIDEKGNKIKVPKTLKEKDSLSAIKNLVRKVKRTIAKFVPDTPTVNFLVANMILKEESNGINIYENLNELECIYLQTLLQKENKNENIY